MKIGALLGALCGLLISTNIMAEQIYLEWDGIESVIQLNDTLEAQEFLKQLPLELKFEDYGTYERVAFLPEKLILTGQPSGFIPITGELTYYAPWGNLAVFIKDFRPSDGLYPLGKLSPEALKAIKDSGDKKVKLFIKE